VPAFVVTSWTALPGHLRGTIDGFLRLSSRDKWLDIHGGKSWANYYSAENKARTQEFFDHFLKGVATPVTAWPRVRVEVRERPSVGRVVPSTAWPLPGTEYKQLYLDATKGALRESPPESEATAEYHSLGGGPEAHRAAFEYGFRKASTWSAT
jgi:hypothetical protein